MSVMMLGGDKFKFAQTCLILVVKLGDGLSYQIHYLVQISCQNRTFSESQKKLYKNVLIRDSEIRQTSLDNFVEI